MFKIIIIFPLFFKIQNFLLIYLVKISLMLLSYHLTSWLFNLFIWFACFDLVFS